MERLIFMLLLSAASRRRYAFGTLEVMFEDPRVAIRWLVAFGCAIAALMVATVVRGEQAPIPHLWGALILGVLIWSVVRMLTSPTPLPGGWFERLRLLLSVALLEIVGVSAAITGAGRVRVAGVVAAIAGAVMLIAAVRDFRLWRAEAARRDESPRPR
jgi:hypothetical protein